MTELKRNNIARIISVFALTVFSISLSGQSINLIGYQRQKVEAVMKEMECTVETIRPFQNGTMLWYNDAKMPVSYIYLIGDSDNTCYGFSIAIQNKYKKFMDAFIDHLNDSENTTKVNGSKWVEKTSQGTFEWTLLTPKDSDSQMLSVKPLRD